MTDLATAKHSLDRIKTPYNSTFEIAEPTLGRQGFISKEIPLAIGILVNRTFVIHPEHFRNKFCGKNPNLRVSAKNQV
jgi:hypothetical protein